MPIYEYECRKCKNLTEVFQKINDKPRTRCDKCGGRLEKLLSAPAIQFKGTGWYVTDYSRKSQPAEKAESDGSKAPASDKKSESKSKDTSPATKNPSSASSSKLPRSD